MTWLVQWTPAGHFAPRHHTFAYESAAEHWADILRTNGHHHVTTHHLNSTEQRENR